MSVASDVRHVYHQRCVLKAFVQIHEDVEELLILFSKEYPRYHRHNTGDTQITLVYYTFEIKE